MYTMNQLTIIGFTGNDAEAHYTQNGTLVVTVSVATKESWKDADGNWQTRTDWHQLFLSESRRKCRKRRNHPPLRSRLC